MLVNHLHLTAKVVIGDDQGYHHLNEDRTFRKLEITESGRKRVLEEKQKRHREELEYETREMNPIQEAIDKAEKQKNTLPLNQSAESNGGFGRLTTSSIVPRRSRLHDTSSFIPRMNSTIPRGITLSGRANKSLDTSIYLGTQSLISVGSSSQSILVQRHIL